jgi:phosphoribosylglycinamide formyltransferase-1
MRIAVLVSGSGSNLQAIIDAEAAGEIPGAKVSLVISSKENAYALERAEKAGIKTAVASDNGTLLSLLEEESPDLIVLAGYMRILPPEVVRAFPRRIINIHPSLIPKYCGMGYYGIKVHEAALAAGEKTTGATVHYADEGVDTGDIILQKEVPILEGDTPEKLQARVLETEHEILPEAIKRITLAGGIYHKPLSSGF